VVWKEGTEFNPSEIEKLSAGQVWCWTVTMWCILVQPVAWEEIRMGGEGVWSKCDVCVCVCCDHEMCF